MFLFFVFFCSVYIGVRWGSEVRGHLHLGSGEPSPTSGGENPPNYPTTGSQLAGGGDSPIKGTSPHHPASPACISLHRKFGTNKKWNVQLLFVISFASYLWIVRLIDCCRLQFDANMEYFHKLAICILLVDLIKDKANIWLQ